jgi:signal transduction histidine kinase
MAVNTDDLRGARLLADVLLRDVERIAEHSAARMQELLHAYAKMPRDELTPVVLANTRNLLEAIRDPGTDPSRAEADYQGSGATRARQGITSDEMLNAWRIGLEVVREQAQAAAEELGIEKDELLEFVVATLKWGDAGMRSSASAHHETEIRELGRLAEEQAALRRVATLVAQDVPASELFHAVAREVCTLLGADFSGMIRYEDDVTVTTAATWAAVGEHPPFPDRSRTVAGDPPSMITESGRPARVDDWTNVPGPIAAFVRRELGVRSSVGTPIVVEGRLWGALAVHSKRGPLPPDTESRLLNFTELVGTAIANTNARAEVQRLAEEQAALQRVATMVAGDCPAEEIFARVAEETGLLVGADAAAIQRYEPDGHASVLGNWGTLRDEFPVGSRVKLEGNTVMGVAYRTQRSARFDDYDNATGPIAVAARRAGLRSSVASPIVVNGRVWGSIATATSGTERLPADAESRIAQFAELVATAISNIQARSEVQRLAEEQAALRRVATMVARQCPPDEVFAQVAREVGMLLGADAAAIQRFEPDGDVTVVGLWGKLSGDAFRLGSRWELDENSVTGLVYRTDRSARLDNYAEASGSIAAEARKAELGSAVGTPIAVDGRLWGAIVVGISGGEAMPSDAESRISEFTELVATAISNVQARSDLAASRARIVATADAERRRVVRDLHDGAQQRLVHTILTLKLARGALERGGEDAAGLVQEALQQAETATDELRELAQGILPSVLTHGGLRAAAAALASRMSMPVEIDVAVGRLPGAVEATAYFLVAEALTNVAKHSHADRANVSARLDRRTLQVEVRDDGAGGANADGTGLVGLKDRLAALDGTLRVESPVGGGTLIAASIPVS